MVELEVELDELDELLLELVAFDVVFTLDEEEEEVVEVVEEDEADVVELLVAPFDPLLSLCFLEVNLAVVLVEVQLYMQLILGVPVITMLYGKYINNEPPYGIGLPTIKLKK